MSMLNWLKQQAPSVQKTLNDQMSRYKNRDLMEAVVAGCAMVGFDLPVGGLEAVGGVAQEDHPQHGHEVVAGGELGVGAQVVRGLPEVGFEFFDVFEAAGHCVTQANPGEAEHPASEQPAEGRNLFLLPRLGRTTLSHRSFPDNHKHPSNRPPSRGAKLSRVRR